jgi:hypothetical protein
MYDGRAISYLEMRGPATGATRDSAYRLLEDHTQPLLEDVPTCLYGGKFPVTVGINGQFRIGLVADMRVLYLHISMMC